MGRTWTAWLTCVAFGVAVLHFLGQANAGLLNGLDRRQRDRDGVQPLNLPATIDTGTEELQPAMQKNHNFCIAMLRSPLLEVFAIV
jgi:hypothetical protein